MDHLLLTRKPIDIGAINELVAHDSCGAISLFVGTTRDNFDGSTVVSLEYEAYEPMALKEMQVICAQLRQNWSDVKNIAIYHRLGLVPVREASVVIGVSSPHRQTALDAVAFAIEELKRRVPIWKKEQYEDDKSAWKENKESGQLIKRKLNFDDCTVQVADSSVVPKNLIQITAKEHEINRRIQCFIQKKREEIDINNIMDFTIKRPKPREGIDAEELSTCARTDAFIIKQDKSKSHLRVRRVKNEYGPQTRPDYGQTLHNLMSDGNTPMKIEQAQTEKGEDTKQNIPFALQERLTNIETHLGLPIPSNDKNIYARIKLMEDRILHLESLSPEYAHFLEQKHAETEDQKRQRRNAELARQRKTYTFQDLDDIIANLMSGSNSEKDDDESNELTYLTAS